MKNYISHREIVLLARVISIAAITISYCIPSQLSASQTADVSDTITEYAVELYDPELVSGIPLTLATTEIINSAQGALSSPLAGTVIVTEGFEASWPTGLWGTTAQSGFSTCTWAKTNVAADVDAWSVSPVAGGTCGGLPGVSYPQDVFSLMFYGPFDLSDATSAEMRFRHAIELGTNDQLLVGHSDDGANFSGKR